MKHQTMIVSSVADMPQADRICALLNDNRIDTRRVPFCEKDPERYLKNLQKCISDSSCVVAFLTETALSDPQFLATVQEIKGETVLWFMPAPLALPEGRQIDGKYVVNEETVVSRVADYVRKTNRPEGATDAWILDLNVTYSGGHVGGVPQGYGKITAIFSSDLEGEFAEGALNGMGRMERKGLSKAEGNFVNNRLCGIGRRLTCTKFRGGYLLEGEFKEHNLVGVGRCTLYATGDFYVGTVDRYMKDDAFLDGKLYDASGALKAIWENGVRREASGEYYSASLTAGDANGEGKLSWPDGAHYEGQLQNGLPHGMGKLVTAGGDVLEGRFREGIAHGRVKCQRIGETFEGTFENGWRSHGRQTMLSGDTYEGAFRDGGFEGRGIYTWKNGSTYCGTFQKGEITGTGEIRWTDGHTYRGTVAHGRPHGEGSFQWTDGDRYEGSVRGGMLDGRGVYTFADGNRYEGQFWEGSFHGAGRYIWPDGTVYTGSMHQGNFSTGEVRNARGELIATYVQGREQ